MRSCIHIAGGVEVRAQDPLEACAEHRFDHLAAARVMILVIAQLRRTGTPHIAIAPIFSPPRFIHLHRRAGANLLLHLSQLRLQLPFHPTRQAYDLSTTDRQAMQVGQIGLNLSDRQAHHGAQIANQAGNLHAGTSLSHHLPAHIQRGFSPGATVAAPAVVDHMLRHFDCWRWR